MVDSAVELTVVIPGYNEEKVIVANINSLNEWLDNNLSGISSEILVIDDGSVDGMAHAVETYASQHGRVRLVKHPTNLG
ncbi:glycosyltransferase, partial [Pseudorhodoplanes sp.]|uniref:glycosyltransferase n=1 Tax=Pseudorhodoplanes sp. TaxID=1934341 RepID=UPI003D128C0F